MEKKFKKKKFLAPLWSVSPSMQNLTQPMYHDQVYFDKSPAIDKQNRFT